MRRIVLAGLALVALGSTVGCSSNPLIGKWQSVEGGVVCGQSLTFTSGYATHDDAKAQPGDAVTYTVQDKVVYVTGTSVYVPGGGAIPYNIVDDKHIFWQSVMGDRCNYVKVN